MKRCRNFMGNLQQLVDTGITRFETGPIEMSLLAEKKLKISLKISLSKPEVKRMNNSF